MEIKISEFKTQKSIFGVMLKDTKKLFYKINESGFTEEINGYDMLKGKYLMPERVYYDDTKIYYEYIEELMTKTLHDVFYFESKEKFNFDKIINQYKNNIDNIVLLNETELKNIKFFAKRINKLDEYKTSQLFNNTYLVNCFEYNPINILNELTDKLGEEKKLYGFLSQGDPTDTNISIDGVFTDFENAGYNSLVGEIAIALASFLTHGNYFYPKYHPETYPIRSKILSIFENNKQKIEYSVLENNKTNIKLDMSFNQHSKEFMADYLTMINNSVSLDVKSEINQYLKYYLCMRLLTPLNVLKMSFDDQLIIIALLLTFYDRISDIQSVINLINEG